MSIFDDHITNHDEYIESQFAVLMIKTPKYCIQHKYYGYMAEQLLAKGDDVKHYYGCQLLNLEIKICSLWYIITGKLIIDYQLETYLARVSDELIRKYGNIIKYKDMFFYPSNKKMEKDIAKILYHDLYGHFGFNGNLRPWGQVEKYINRMPIPLDFNR